MTLKFSFRVPECLVLWLWPDAARHVMAAGMPRKRTWSWGTEGLSVDFRVDRA